MGKLDNHFRKATLWSEPGGTSQSTFRDWPLLRAQRC
jgi:hypothetical protein